jgi:hypothetical protein
LEVSFLIFPITSFVCSGERLKVFQRLLHLKQLRLAQV